MLLFMADDILKKPILRGHFHQAAFFFSLGLCSMLVAKSQESAAFLSAFIYSLSLCGLFGVSALYHRPMWQPKGRMWMRRLDHSCIFFLIAGTATPICILALPPETGVQALKIIWIASSLGILQSLFWVTAPRWVTAASCVAAGLLLIPYLPDFYSLLGLNKVILLVVGGFFYVVGAVVYASKFPDPYPKYFGYHEIFHLLVILAAAIQFLVIYSLVR